MIIFYLNLSILVTSTLLHSFDVMINIIDYI